MEEENQMPTQVFTNLPQSLIKDVTLHTLPMFEFLAVVIINVSLLGDMTPYTLVYMSQKRVTLYCLWRVLLW